MNLQISLAPGGDLRLTLPTGRNLDIAATEAGCRFLVKMLRDAAADVRDQPGYIREFPTQHVINAWMKQDKIAKRKKVAEAAEASAAARGVDLSALDFSL